MTVLVLAAVALMAAALEPAFRPTALGVKAVDTPIVPEIDWTMKQWLRSVYLEGLKAGNRPGVFIKVGDSISESEFFLVDVGCGVENLAGRTGLAGIIDFFRGTDVPFGRRFFLHPWCGESNSFTRVGEAAVSGWVSGSPLERFREPVEDCPAPFDTPLACEVHLLRPALAIVMLGSNDVSRQTDLAQFRQNIKAVVRALTAAGVIPILSTIPPRLDEENARVPAYNEAITAVAIGQQVPLINYWRAMQRRSMIDHGIGEDGGHPSVFGCPSDCASADFSVEGLRYGYNVRNLTAIQALAKVKRIVFDNR